MQGPRRGVRSVYDTDGRLIAQSDTDGATNYYYSSTTEGVGGSSSASCVGELARITSTLAGTTTDT